MKCELSYTGDDPIGLWPVSADAESDPVQCQQNIVIRNNVARWPRQYAGMRAGSSSPRDFSRCDCLDVPSGQCYRHPCWATYAGGSGVQWVNNHCEGAFNVLAFNGDYPNPKQTKWCGVLAVVGNTYSQIQGQGSGCRLNSSVETICSNRPNPPGTVGGQCTNGEAKLPPPCSSSSRFTLCRAAAGVGGICYNNSGGPVSCIPATKLANGALQVQAYDFCHGYTSSCTIYS